MDPQILATPSFESLADSVQIDTTPVAGTTDGFPDQDSDFDFDLSAREYYSSTDPGHPINLPNNLLDKEGLVYTDALLDLHRSIWDLSDEDAQKLGGTAMYSPDDKGRLRSRRLFACGLPIGDDDSDVFATESSDANDPSHIFAIEPSDATCPSDFFEDPLLQFPLDESSFQFSEYSPQGDAFFVPSQDLPSFRTFDWSGIVPQVTNDALVNFQPSACTAVSVAGTFPNVVDTESNTPSTVVEEDQLVPDCCEAELPVEKTSDQDASTGSGSDSDSGNPIASVASTIFIHTPPVPESEQNPFDFSKPPAEPSTGPIRTSSTKHPHASFDALPSSSSNADYISCIGGRQGPPICGWTTDNNNQPLSKPCSFIFHDASHDAIQAHLASHLPEDRKDIPSDHRGRIKCMWEGCKNARVAYPLLVEHLRKQHVAVYWKCKRCGVIVKKGNEKNRHKQLTDTGASRCDIQVRLQEQDRARGKV